MDKDYINPDNYSEQHQHIGYYENNCDIECVALERKIDGSWDVFFNDFKSEIECEELFLNKNILKDKTFGIFLFNTNERDIYGKFKLWILNVLLPYRVNTNN